MGVLRPAMGVPQRSLYLAITSLECSESKEVLNFIFGDSLTVL